MSCALPVRDDIVAAIYLADPSIRRTNRLSRAGTSRRGQSSFYVHPGAPNPINAERTSPDAPTAFKICPDDHRNNRRRSSCPNQQKGEYKGFAPLRSPGPPAASASRKAKPFSCRRVRGGPPLKRTRNILLLQLFSGAKMHVTNLGWPSCQKNPGSLRFLCDQRR